MNTSTRKQNHLQPHHSAVINIKISEKHSYILRTSKGNLEIFHMKMWLSYVNRLAQFNVVELVFDNRFSDFERHF